MSYPSNQPSVAQDQLKAFVERIMRMREEAKAINRDIREIYAEAKGNGYDKTVLGQVVSYIEKRAKDPDLAAERSELFDLYLGAIDGTVSAVPRVHTRAHEGVDANGDGPTQAPPVDTIQTAHVDGDIADAVSGDGPVHAPVIAEPADEVVAPAVASSVNPNRPHCRKPHACASTSWKAHCYSCQKAAAEADGFSA